MRKGRDGEKKKKKKGEKNWGGKNGEKKGKEKTDENSGHYIIASSRPPERRPLTAGTTHSRANFVINIIIFLPLRSS